MPNIPVEFALFFVIQPVLIVQLVISISAIVAAADAFLDRRQQEAFHDADEDTAYYKQYLFRRRPVPLEKFPDRFPNVSHPSSSLYYLYSKWICPCSYYMPFTCNSQARNPKYLKIEKSTPLCYNKHISCLTTF